MGKLLRDIKNDAIGNNTKIQTSEEQKLEGVLNKLFFEQKNVEEEALFVKTVMTRGQVSQERRGLHASALIKGEKEFCLRMQVLSLLYKQLQGEQIRVGLKRIFEEGNAIHEKWQRLFIRGGYATHKDLDVTQFNEEFKISFTPDIICTIPDVFDGKAICEIKSVNTFQFQKMQKHPTAWKQLQWYMYLSGIHKGFVLDEDKNTQDFKVEIYDFDYSIVEPFVNRAKDIKVAFSRVIKKNKMVKRPSDAKSPDCKRCEQCALRNVCWNINGGGDRL